MADDTVIFGLQTSKNACNVRIKYLRLNCMLLFVVVFSVSLFLPTISPIHYIFLFGFSD